MPRAASRAFTLIELLVVIAILATLAGLILSSDWLRRDEAAIRVEQAARGVERKLLEARNLALTTGRPHAVVFHIENKGSGRILRNLARDEDPARPSRHWCAVIGPKGNSEYLPRLPQYMDDNSESYGSAQRLAATVEKSQIGERFHLPRGTRFLALGDAEDNLHHPTTAPIPYDTTRFAIADWSLGTAARTGIAAYSNTYPRPWFGFLEPAGAQWVLHPFAGYDPAIYGSGLDYECVNRGGDHNYMNSSMKVFLKNNAQTRHTVTNSTNDKLCECWVVPGNAATPAQNSLLEEMRPCCDASQVGKPRPVVNGYWMDFTIVFLADGQAKGLTFYNRLTLFSQFSDAISGSRPYPRQVADHRYSPTVTNWTFHGRDDGIIHLLGEAAGGPSITIARDAESDDPSFATPQAALKSLTPMRRIFVSEPTGGVRVITPYTRIQNWLDAIESGIPESRRIWKDGWVWCTADDPSPDKIRVTGALQDDMLLQHDPYPWIKPKP